MQWFDIGAFIGGIVAGAIGFAFGWWAHDSKQKRKDKNTEK